MRRHLRSYLSSFIYGLVIATGTAGGLMATHHFLAPPSPDQEIADASTHLKSTPADIATAGVGVEKWARQAQPPPQSEPGPQVPKANQATAPVPAARPPTPVVAPAQNTGEAQRSLARNIQRELKRVGCYTGDVDGDWSATTRTAMKAFNETVRVQFPVTAPDYILLTLLQGQTERACGKIDPSITAKAPVPRQVVRATPARDPVVDVGEPRTVTIVQPRPAPPAPANPVVGAQIPTESAPMPGRMAIGGPALRIETPAAIAPPVARIAAPPPDQAAPQSAPRVQATPPRPAPTERKASPPPSRQANSNPAPTYRGPSPPRQTESRGLFSNLSRNAP